MAYRSNSVYESAFRYSNQKNESWIVKLFKYFFQWIYYQSMYNVCSVCPVSHKNLFADSTVTRYITKKLFSTLQILSKICESAPNPGGSTTYMFSFQAIKMNLVSCSFSKWHFWKILSSALTQVWPLMTSNRSWSLQIRIQCKISNLLRYISPIFNHLEDHFRFSPHSHLNHVIGHFWPDPKVYSESKGKMGENTFFRFWIFWKKNIKVSH